MCYHVMMSRYTASQCKYKYATHRLTVLSCTMLYLRYMLAKTVQLDDPPVVFSISAVAAELRLRMPAVPL